MRFKSLLLCFTLALFAPTGLAGTAGTGTIQGTITDGPDGSPVEGVTLRIGSTTLFGGFYPDPDVPAAITQADGSYSMPVVPSGPLLVLSIEPPAPLMPKFWPDFACLSWALCSPNLNLAFRLDEGEVMNADAWVSVGGALSGTVKTDNGAAPIAGAYLRIEPQFNAAFYQTVVTDEAGYYEARNLPVGAYQVSVFASGYLSEKFDDILCDENCSSGPFTPVEVASDAVRGGVNFDLTLGSVIAGRVTEPNGVPPKISVGVTLGRLVDGQFTSYRNSEVSLENGEYAFIGLPAGTYVVATNSTSGLLTHAHEVYDNVACVADQCTNSERGAGTPIVIGLNEVRQGVDFEIEPAGSISGCVFRVETGLPFPDVRVVVYRTRTYPFPSVSTVSTGTTDSDGCYRIDYLPSAGTPQYQVRTANREGFVDKLYPYANCFGGGCNLSHATALALQHDQDLAGIDFELTRGASISGNIRSTQGDLVEGALISIFSSGGAEVRPEDRASQESRPGGAFQTYGLVDGTYFLRADVTEGPMAGSYVFGAPQQPGQPLPPVTSGTPVVIAGGVSVTNIDFVISTNAIFDDGFE